MQLLHLQTPAGIAVVKLVLQCCKCMHAGCPCLQLHPSLQCPGKRMPVLTLLLLRSWPVWHWQYYLKDMQCVSHILPVVVRPPVCLSDALFHAVASTVGAILVFPGPSHMELGKSTQSPPFLTGLGWALTVWITAPTFTACGCALLYLLFRNKTMRNEDPLHTAL